MGAIIINKALGMSHPAFTTQTQSITALWPVLISRPAEGRRLSWPGWLVNVLTRICVKSTKKKNGANELHALKL